MAVVKCNERPYKGESLLGIFSDYVVVDLETTGLDPRNDRIIEFGAIKVRNNQKESKFNMLVNPERRINLFITRLTGITNAMLEDALKIEEALPKFLDFVGDDIVIGHNVNFDVNFIYETCHRVLSRPFTNDFTDTMRLSRKLFPEHAHHKLTDLINRFSIGESVEHRALADADQTNECYIYMKKYIEENEIDIESIL